MEKDDFRDFIENCIDAYKKVGHLEIRTDLLETARLVHFFASRYGLGAHKSLETYWEMIEKSDPVILRLLQEAAIEEHEAMWGNKDKRGKEYSGKVSKGRKSRPRRSNAKDSVVENETGMLDFLRQMGASKDELEEAAKMAKKRKTKKEVDLSDINTDNLLDVDGFNTVEAIKKIKEANKGAVDIKVNWRTLMERQKKPNG